MKIIDGSYPPVPTAYSVNLREVVHQLLTKDASQRPSALQLLASPPLVQAASELEIALPQPAMELFHSQLVGARLQDETRVAAARQSQTMSRLAQPKRSSATLEPAAPVTTTSTTAVTAANSALAAAPVASVSNLHLALQPGGNSNGRGGHTDTDAAGGPPVVDPLTGAGQASPMRGRKARPRGGAKASNRSSTGPNASPIKPAREQGAARGSALTPRGGRVRVRGRGAAGATVGRTEAAAARTRHRPLPPAAQEAAAKAADSNESAYRRRSQLGRGRGSQGGRSVTARGGSRSTTAGGARNHTRGSVRGRSPADDSQREDSKHSEEHDSSVESSPYRHRPSRSGEALRGGGRQSSTAGAARRVTVQDVLQVSNVPAANGGRRSGQEGGGAAASGMSPRTSPVQMQDAFGDLAIAGAGLGGHSIDPTSLAPRMTPSRSSKRRSDISEAQQHRPVPRRPPTASGKAGSHSPGDSEAQRLKQHNYPSEAGAAVDDNGEVLEPTVTSMPLSARGMLSTPRDSSAQPEPMESESKASNALPPIRGASRGGVVTPGPRLLRREGGAGGSRSARSSYTGGTTGGIGAATAGPMPAVLAREGRARDGVQRGAWAGGAAQGQQRDASAGAHNTPPQARPKNAWSDPAHLPVSKSGLRALDSTTATVVHSTIDEVTEPLTDDTPPQSGRGGAHETPLGQSMASTRSFLHGAGVNGGVSGDSTWDSFDDSFLRHQAIAEASVGDSKADDAPWQQAEWQPSTDATGHGDAKHTPMQAQREVTPAEVEENIEWGSGDSASAGVAELNATGGTAHSHFLAATHASASDSASYLPRLNLPSTSAASQDGPALSARPTIPSGGGEGGWSLEQHGYGRPILRHTHSEPSSPRDIRASSPDGGGVLPVSSRLHVNAAAASKSGLLLPQPGTARNTGMDSDSYADSVDSESIGDDSSLSDGEGKDGDSEGSQGGSHQSSPAQEAGMVSRRRDIERSGATNLMGDGRHEDGAVRETGARPRQLDVPEHFLPVQPGRVESAPLSPLTDDEDDDGGLPSDVPDAVVAQSAESDADAAHMSATAGAHEAASIGMSHPAVRHAIRSDSLLHSAEERLEALQCAAGELQYRSRLASVDAEEALDEGGVAAEEAQMQLEVLQADADRAKRRVTGLAKWLQERSELHLRQQQLAAACRHIKAPTAAAAAMLDSLLKPPPAQHDGSVSGPTSPAAGSADDIDALLSQLTGEQQLLLFKLQFFHGKLRDSTAAYHARFSGDALSP